MKSYIYPELSMQAPAQLAVKKYEFKNEFPTAGCCYLRPQEITVMVMPGKFPDQSSLQKTLVKLSGVALDRWTLGTRPPNKRSGWVWREERQVAVGDKLVYAVFGASARNTYFLALYAAKGDYQAWVDSLLVN